MKLQIYKEKACVETETILRLITGYAGTIFLSAVNQYGHMIPNGVICSITPDGLGLNCELDPVLEFTRASKGQIATHC